MGKPGNKNQSSISNIYGKVPGASDISKDRYTDPEIEGLGSPYDQTRKATKAKSQVGKDPKTGTGGGGPNTDAAPREI